MSDITFYKTRSKGSRKVNRARRYKKHALFGSGFRPAIIGKYGNFHSNHTIINRILKRRKKTLYPYTRSLLLKRG